MLTRTIEMALSAGFLLLLGCRQIVGIEEREVFEDEDEDAGNAVVPACGLSHRGASCAACMELSCCTKAEQCADDSTCMRTEDCAQRCPAGDSACRLSCSNQWEPVNLSQAQLGDCREQACVDECGPWDCLGNVSWQVPDAMPATITISATIQCTTCSSVGGIAPIAGVHARVCSIADTECRAALGIGDSGEDGRVTVTVRAPTDPMPVFLEFHRQDGAWLDNLLMLNTPPLSYDFDVGVVYMERAENLDTVYDPERAIVKLRVSNCNLEPSTGVALNWADLQENPIVSAAEGSDWNAIVVDVPVPESQLGRVVARLTEPPTAVPGDAERGPVIAVTNLVLRRGTVTLAPFVTPTPIFGP